MSSQAEYVTKGDGGFGSELVSTEVCISPDYFEQEREKIFKRMWLNVGRIDDAPEPGSYFVKRIPTLKTDILVVHGKDGSIRAFHNVCRHRGNKLARECSGKAKGFTCAFHGWTFDLEGNLIYRPDEDLFEDFDKADFGLLPVAAETWCGFIFVHMDPDPPQSLKAFLGELGESLEEFPFERMTLAGKYGATVNCNWKVFLDAVEEGFHAPHLHKTSYPEVFTAGEVPTLRMGGFRIYDLHHKASVPGNPDPQLTPAEALARKFGQALIQTSSGEAPGGVNPGGIDDWVFDINVIFPNFFIDPSSGWYFTYNFWPLSVDWTYYETKFYMPPAKNAGERISQEYALVLFRDVQLEDLSTVEDAQNAIASGVLPAMPLSEQEIMLRHKYRVVDELVNDQRS